MIFSLETGELVMIKQVISEIKQQLQCANIIDLSI